MKTWLVIFILTFSISALATSDVDDDQVTDPGDETTAVENEGSIITAYKESQSTVLIVAVVLVVTLIGAWYIVASNRGAKKALVILLLMGSFGVFATDDDPNDETPPIMQTITGGSGGHTDGGDANGLPPEEKAAEVSKNDTVIDGLKMVNGVYYGLMFVLVWLSGVFIAEVILNKNSLNESC